MSEQNIPRYNASIDNEPPKPSIHFALTDDGSWAHWSDVSKQIAALTAENARLKASVSDAEWRKFVGVVPIDVDDTVHTIDEMAERIEVDALIAARASTPPDANTTWFCVPCGFTTKDAAEAQAHLGPHMLEITCPFDEQIWRFHTQAQADMLQKHLDHHAAPTPTPEAR